MKTMRDSTHTILSNAAFAAVVGTYLLACTAAYAQKSAEPAPADTTKTTTTPADKLANKTNVIGFQFNSQATVISQSLLKFRSPYSGDFSLISRDETEVSESFTLYMGVRVRPNLDIYIDPEEVAGLGVSNSLGTAGFLNGEVIRNPLLNSEPYLARYFARYMIATGKGEEVIGGGIHQVGGKQPTHRLVLTGGKLGTNDVFDVSSYANSARTQFMNWALLNNGAYDYAADTRGYSRGVAAEWIAPTHAIRFGSFQMPTVANGIDLANNLAFNRGDQLEIELHPHAVRGKAPTIVRLLGFRNMAHMGDYREAIAQSAASGTRPDITKAAHVGAIKYGYGINIEQALADDGATGIWARLGADDGKTDSFAFTEIDSHVSFGGQLSGAQWHRPKDRFATAFVSNGLSSPHRDYLAAGGYGFIIGDGRLNYGREQIFESYYTFQLNPTVGLSLDYQRLTNPAYNKDRGPVDVISLRTHIEF